MTTDELLTYCLGKPGAWQDVKCGTTREVADEWLARFPEDAMVMPYIGRSGWNSLRLGGGIPDEDLREAIDASYDMVVRKLPRKDRPSAGG